MKAQKPEDLADCVVPLDEDEIRELHRYWDRVICEAWSTPAAPAPIVPTSPLAEQRRNRRTARRAMRLVSRAARSVEVIALDRGRPGPAGGEAA